MGWSGTWRWFWGPIVMGVPVVGLPLMVAKRLTRAVADCQQATRRNPARRIFPPSPPFRPGMARAPDLCHIAAAPHEPPRRRPVRAASAGAGGAAAGARHDRRLPREPDAARLGHADAGRPHRRGFRGRGLARRLSPVADRGRAPGSRGGLRAVRGGRRVVAAVHVALPPRRAHPHRLQPLGLLEHRQVLRADLRQPPLPRALPLQWLRRRARLSGNPTRSPSASGRRAPSSACTARCSRSSCTPRTAPSSRAASSSSSGTASSASSRTTSSSASPSRTSTCRRTGAGS